MKLDAIEPADIKSLGAGAVVREMGQDRGPPFQNDAELREQVCVRVRNFIDPLGHRGAKASRPSTGG